MKREQMERERQGVDRRLDSRSAQMDALREQLKTLEAEQAQDCELLETLVEQWEKLPALAEPKDAARLSEQITAARATNLAIDRREKAERMDAEIATVSEAVEKLSSAIDGYRDKAAHIIANAKYPVDGLGFAEDEVMYNGLPFSQASNAEQIKVSIAMGMVANPKLRVMRIKDGSLLDDDSMKVVEKMADDFDYQVFIEIVDVSGKVGVYLVDGEIAAIDGQEAAPLKLKKALAPARKKPVQKEKV
jgi:hypothetical protein